MKISNILASVAFSVFLFPAAASANDIPKFGKTCIGSFQLSKNICLSSNGKTVSSTYMFRGNLPTQGTHTNCALKGKTIVCSGGQYRTARGDGKMNSVSITMRGNVPASMTWR